MLSHPLRVVAILLLLAVLVIARWVYNEYVAPYIEPELVEFQRCFERGVALSRGVEMMTTRLIVEERRAGHPAREEALLIQHAEAIGLPVTRMTWKPFVNGRVRPKSGDVFAGSIQFVRRALQSTGNPLPLPNPYPESLSPFLHREVWRSGSLGSVLLARSTYPDTALFIKPAKRWKLFTGFVVDQPNPAELYGVSRHEPVWCSEVVKFRSEWRVYVINHEVQYVALCDYGGDRAAAPDMGEITRAIAAYAPVAPVAYVMDFFVLNDGRTALIEVNDGFSVGAYDNVPAPVYFRLIEARWHEMAKQNEERK